MKIYIRIFIVITPYNFRPGKELRVNLVKSKLLILLIKNLHVTEVKKLISNHKAT